MGWSDIFTSSKDGSESEVLIAPRRGRGESIISQDGYGTMSMSSSFATGGHQNGARATSSVASPPRFSHEQRARMAEISRAAGSHMRPIGTYMLGQGRGCASPLLRSVSQTSSRGSSPSPIRPLSSPPGGILGSSLIKPRTVSDASHDSQYTDLTTSTHSDLTRSRSSSSSPEPVVDANGVVHKSIFGDAGLKADRPRTSSGSRPASGRRRRVR